MKVKCKNNLIMKNQPLKVFTKNKIYEIIDKSLSFGGFILLNDEDREHTIPRGCKWYNEFTQIKEEGDL